MLREHLFQKKAPSDPCFRWRGGDVSRLEGLSDGVFAFALTLLVVSLSVPQNFYEVWLTIRDFPAFAMSFAVLIMCWYSHYIFFRRYGLEDFLTMFINMIIMFLVLFYVFPLRFMATLIWRQILGDNRSEMFAVPPDAVIAHLPGSQTFWLVVFYSAGIIGIFGLFLLLKVHAFRLRRVLELDEIEIYLTKAAIWIDTTWILIAIGSIMLAFFSPPFAGLIYCLLGPVQGTIGTVMGTRAERMYEAKYGHKPGSPPETDASSERPAEASTNKPSAKSISAPASTKRTNDKEHENSIKNEKDEE